MRCSRVHLRIFDAPTAHWRCLLKPCASLSRGMNCLRACGFSWSLLKMEYGAPARVLSGGIVCIMHPNTSTATQESAGLGKDPDNCGNIGMSLGNQGSIFGVDIFRTTTRPGTVPILIGVARLIIVSHLLPSSAPGKGLARSRGAKQGISLMLNRLP